MKHLLSTLLLAVAATATANAASADIVTLPGIEGKQIYIPTDLRINDFDSDTAQWSRSRMLLTPDFAIFWERGFGNDLQNPPQLEGNDMSVNLDNLARQLERFFHFYTDTLHFVHRGESLTDSLRMMVMLNYSLEGTAYGGDYDGVIGAFWVAPNRIKDTALNCVAHELGHSFQMQAAIDYVAAHGGERWMGGGFFEMTSQWMLWRVNPYWQRDELFHWQAYQQQPHRAFLSWENVYHTPYALQWWAQRHGLDIIGRIFREGRYPEDPADAYMRLTSTNFDAFNDELFEAARHTIFLDFDHAREATRPYIGHWPQTDAAGAPEEGGFDARLMPTPSRGETITVDFQGRRTSPTDGWRYGFVALMADGSCHYGDIYNKDRARVSFKADADVRELYLVVMGAPAVHHTGTAERPTTYPYTINVTSSRRLTSPNGRLTADIGMRDGQVAYTICLDGRPLLKDARAALTFEGSNLRSNLRRLSRESRTEHIDAFAYRQGAIDVTYNVETYRVAPGLDIEFRAYDEGVAYRFVKTDKRRSFVADETALFIPATDARTILAYSTNDTKPEAMAFQNTYTVAPLSELPRGKWAFLPATMDFGTARVTLLESDLRSYPGMFLTADTTTASPTLTARFARRPTQMEYYSYRGMNHVAATAADIAEVSGARTMPWRIIAVATDDRQMPVSNLVYALAEPSRVSDTSWIQTGKSAWDWWHDWNLSGVPFRPGINMATYRYYIDFAARYGLQYAILDEGWYDSNRALLMQSIADIDVQQLVDYGRERGVGIILWTVFNVLDEHLEEACAKYAAMGVKGFKVDFLDRNDQQAVEMAYRIAEACARHHLILDYHGFYPPTGLNRTFPNIINFESVFGMEEMKWNADRRDMPLYDVTFPFLRQQCGPVDYTPGAMRNATQKDFRDIYDLPMSMGTRAHQAATYVVHDSPLTMLADAATAYELEPDYTRFIASIPNAIDETRIPQGRIGQYIVSARRAGSDWYVGGMTNWDARDIELRLDFLTPGATYEATLLADGPNADRNAGDYAISTFPAEAGAGTVIPIHLAPGGGFVLRLRQK